MSSNPLAIHETAELVLNCVCTTMVEMSLDETLAYPGCPCRTYVSPGAPVLDVCCDNCGDEEVDSRGQLTVYVSDAYPTESFPTRAALLDPCRPAVYVAIVVVTVARCVAGMDDTGHDPSAEELGEVARLVALDHFATLRALNCCVRADPPPGKQKRRVSITSFAKLPESGGCAGFNLTAAVEIGNLCPCPSETSGS